MHMQHNGSPIFLLQLHVMKSTSHGFHDKFAAPEHRTNQQIFFLVGEALRHWAVLLACFTVCPNSCGHMDCTMGRGPKALLAKAIKPSGAGRNGGLWSHQRGASNMASGLMIFWQCLGCMIACFKLETVMHVATSNSNATI